MYSRGGSGAKEVLTDLCWRPVIVALDEPLVVVEITELLEGLVEVLDVGEGVDPEKLFFEGAPEPLDAAVAFGGTDEGRTGVHAEEAQFSLVGAGDELAPIVVAQLETGSDGLPHAAEGCSAGLVERDDGLVSIGLEGGVDAKQLAGAMVVDAKDRGLLAVEQHGRGGIRAPHLIGSQGSDRAVVGPWAEDAARLSGRLEAVLPHEKADAFYICVDPAVAQAGVDFPITLAHEGRIGEDVADGDEQVTVGHQGLGAALLERHRTSNTPLGIHRGTRNPQFIADGDEGCQATSETDPLATRILTP